LSFLTALSYWGLNAVAIELENPFGEDVNDLPLHELCATLNERILELGCSHVQDTLETVHEFSGMFAKGRLPHGPTGWENLVPHKATEPSLARMPTGSVVHGVHANKFSSNDTSDLQEEAGDEKQAPYKLRPYIKKGVIHSRAKTEQKQKPPSNIDTDSGSGKEELELKKPLEQELKKPPDPVMVAPKKPIGKTGLNGASAKWQGDNSQAGTGECSTPGSANVLPGTVSASRPESESSSSINPSATSIVQTPDVALGAPVHALVHSHRTEALLQQSASQSLSQSLRSPSEVQFTTTSPSGGSLRGPHNQDAVWQIAPGGIAGQLGTDELVYAGLTPSQSDAAGAEYRRVAVEDVMMPGQSPRSYIMAPNTQHPATSSQQLVASTQHPAFSGTRFPSPSNGSNRTYAASQAGGYEHYAASQAGGYEHQATHWISPSGELTPVSPAGSQQSPRYVYIMLPRVQQRSHEHRSHSAGGYTSNRNLVAVPQQRVQQGGASAQLPPGSDELC
jgi:hypothetical protein